MLVGIGLIGVLTATVASYFVGQQADEGKAELVERLDRIETLLVALTSSEKDQWRKVPDTAPNNPE